MWAYLTLKLGWLNISAGTNVGPQSNTYLSVPAYLMGCMKIADPKV